jgi:hypothetical protein
MCWKCPKTYNELKAIAACEEQGVRVRGKRSKKHLPTNYDDLAYGHGYSRNWKRYRFHQTKGVSNKTRIDWVAVYNDYVVRTY